MIPVLLGLCVLVGLGLGFVAMLHNAFATNPCPRCGSAHFAMSERLLFEATASVAGAFRQTTACRLCGHTEVVDTPIPPGTPYRPPSGGHQAPGWQPLSEELDGPGSPAVDAGGD